MKDEWQSYPNDRKMMREDGFVVIVPNDAGEALPLWCDVCETLYRSSDDEAAHLEFGCCHTCALAWAHARREQWKNGWRPTQEQVEEHLKQRPPLSLDVHID